ncbi:type III secretion system translocon subunit SctE [Rouxiella sp. WC2420]|uniref:Type III secretion system translocon subunit SctE n=1 Tax=Rouxiella sp. WC2420 TaxID=3234145 RepID=A0AB39VKY0_9GAMM
MNDKVNMTGPLSLPAARQFNESEEKVGIHGFIKINDFITLAKQVTNDMLAVPSNLNHPTKCLVEKPALASPKDSTHQDMKSGGLTALVGALMLIISSSNSDKFKSRIAQINALSQAKAAATEIFFENYKQAVELGMLSQKTAASAHEELLSANSKYHETKSHFQILEKQLASLLPSDINFSKIKKELNEADKKLTLTNSLRNDAKKIAIAAALDASQKIIAADSLWSNAQKADSPDVLNDINNSHLTGMAAVTLLLGQLSNLINDNADNKLKSNAELTKKLQEARQAEMLANAKEQAEAIAKAEKLNKTMGCVGKIVGGLLLVVGAVGAVFSGGATLVIAAVGLALMAADVIVKAVTGKSITDRLMAPILEHVIQPMMKYIAEVVEKILKKLGVDEKDIKIISTAVSAVVVAVVIIVASVVAKNVAKVILKNMMPMIKRLISKIIPAVVKNSAKIASGAVRTQLQD